MNYYVVDAFTDQLFCGNPAGVCLVEGRIGETLMQKIAFENNLAETAFVARRKDEDYDLRWFTPQVEIDLCGHATLASAFVLMRLVDRNLKAVRFHTKIGLLTVRRDGNLLVMDFPSRKPLPCPTPAALEAALGVKVLETHMSRDLLVLVEDAAVLKEMSPDFHLLAGIREVFGFILTAKGDDCDFVSRFFAPNAGINEDPVTGSSHSTLIPFWSERLRKTEMTAKQLSFRGGSLICRDLGDRVESGGTAVLYLSGEIL